MDNEMGNIFGAFTVVGQVGRTVTVRCRCGRQVPRSIGVLYKDQQSGKVSSCGCLRPGALPPIADGQQLKTLFASPEFLAWENMISRCHNDNHELYADYGYRGWVVCASWRNSFIGFCLDMGAAPTGQYLTVRREKRGKPYEPGNCSWQANDNKHGRRTLQQLSLRNNISVGVMHTRLDANWSLHEASTIPQRK